MTRSKQLVMEAFKAVKANAGAGVDRQSIGDFERHLKHNLYKVWNRMSSGSYFPPPVKAMEIPKKNGGVRILGVLARKDRHSEDGQNETRGHDGPIAGDFEGVPSDQTEGKYGEGIPASDYVLSERTEQSVSQNTLRHGFKRNSRKAGLREIPVHDSGQFYASILISEGTPIAYVKEQLGHASIQMTVDRYAHWVPSGNHMVNILDSQSSATHTQPHQIEKP